MNIKPVKSLKKRNERLTYDKDRYFELTQRQFIKILVNYKIPVAKETVDAIKRNEIFLVEK